jgi:peptide/nickel transport system ATP-binding protein
LEPGTSNLYRIRISAHGKPLAAIDRFEIPPRRITFLFGESGIGKSILSKAIFGLLDPQALEVTVNGMAYPDYLRTPHAIERQQHGFFVFQEPSSHLNPLMTIEEQLREGSLAGGQTEEAILRRLWETTQGAGVRQLLKVYPKPHRPSGGEKQRFLLAMAFKKMERYLEAASPSAQALFVFDEPTGSLDNATRNLFLALLFDRFRRRPFTTLLITHDYSMISEVYRRHADLVPSVVFRELALLQGRLTLSDFSPESYLDWLAANRTAFPERRETRPPSEDALLRLESGVRVFGRRLIISREAGRGEPCPLVIRRGQMVYLKAPSGAGKTTLAKVVMGLIRGKGLDLRIGGLHLTDATPARLWQQRLWGKKIGMVFQHADEALNLNATVEGVFAGLPYPEDVTPAHVREMLAAYFPFEVDAAFLRRPVKHLSGGQKQRLNLLRTLSLDTDLVILDEPLNGLDFLSIKRVIALLAKKQEEGKGLLLISHNEEIFDSLDGVDRLYLHVDA